MLPDTVKIRVTSFLNINFDHVIDTGIDRLDWSEMSDREQADVAAEVIFDKAIAWTEVTA
jgi:hypothetical protein